MRFTDWTETDIRAAIRRLEDALTRGVLEVEYNGERVRYSSAAQIEKVLTALYRELGRRGLPGGVKPKRLVYFATSKGY